MSGQALFQSLSHPTISKKFALFFAVLLVIVIASVLVVERSLDRLKGTGTQIDLSGSLRYLARNLQVNSQHYAVLGMRADMAELDENIASFRLHSGILRGGGSHLGRTIPPLSQALQSELAEIEATFNAYEMELRVIMADADRRMLYEQHSENLNAYASQILESANNLTYVLSEQVENTRAEIHDTLVRLALIDGAILFIALLAIRTQVVRPLRGLAATSRRIAQGQYDEGLEYAFTDEIGELATSIDNMAAAIKSREAELIKSRESLLGANRALHLLSSVNHATIGATDEQALLNEMCALAVSKGGYHSAFAGRAENDAEQTLSIVASEGMPDEYLTTLKISWADNVRGQGVAGTAVRENRASIAHGIRTNPRYENWREIAVKLGFEDAIGLPVKVDGRIWGVICLYSTHPNAFDENETRLLQEMANDLGFGMEMLRVRQKQQASDEALREANERLEYRVLERTKALKEANRELEAFSYTVSHDLRVPLRSMDGFANLLSQEYGPALDATGQDYLARIRKAAQKMAVLIDDLLDLSRISRAELVLRDVDLSGLASELIAEFNLAEPNRQIRVEIDPNITVQGDPGLLRALLQNLLGNAWKYTGKTANPVIRFGQFVTPSDEQAFHVSDNGVGFDMAQADRLFQPFIRLHRAEDFAGTGVGLATASRIVSRHGGRIWARSEMGKGSAFFFTLSGNG